jgi:glycosyltransferase involved in cell wall biosynthesis
MIGQKGIPARYGGVETHVEQISTRLAARGHDVSVFCRSRFRPGPEVVEVNTAFRETEQGLTFKDVRLVFRPSINTKHFDAASHTFFCAAESALRRSFDIVHFHGIGPSAFAPIPRLSGQTVISTVHALDWRQAKWGKLAKQRLLKGEEMGVRRSNGVIAVSRILVDYVRDRYGVEARYIPNGAAVVNRRPPERIRRWGLEEDNYILTVGRIIPERGLHHLIEAFKGIDTPHKLVITGSEAPVTGYSDRLRAMADDRVVFTGDQYRETLLELYSNCSLYVLASEVEGLPITVCEAMGFGRCVLLSDIPENLEAGGDVAFYFSTNNVNELRDQLDALLRDGAVREERGAAGVQRIEEEYNWERLGGEVETFYLDVLKKR